MNNQIEKVTSMCIAELSINGRFREAFTQDTWERIILVHGLFALYEYPAVQALDSILVECDAFSEKHRPKSASKKRLFRDARVYRLCADKPGATFEKVRDSICAWLIKQSGIQIQDPNLRETLKVDRRFALASMSILSLGNRRFRELAQKTQKTMDYCNGNEEVFVQELRRIYDVRLRRIFQEFTGRNVFDPSGHVHKQNEKWIHDLFTAICDQIHRNHAPEALILKNLYEERVKEMVRRRLPVLKDIAESREGIANQAFKEHPLGRFLYSPEWEDFRRTLRPLAPVVDLKKVKEVGAVPIRPAGSKVRRRKDKKGVLRVPTGVYRRGFQVISGARDKE